MNLQPIKNLFSKKIDTADLAGKSLNRINKSLDEYNEAMNIIGNLGFTIEKFNLCASGVETAVSGSLEKINKDELSKLVESHKNQKIIASILKALITAKSTQERVDHIPLKGVRLDLKLGWPPKMDLEFLTEI